MLIAIWAMTSDGLVGQDNGIPWYIKAEFQHFRQTTLNQDVIMGKNTFLSLPKILDQRQMYVLSDDPTWKVDHPNVKVIDHYETIIQQYQYNLQKDLYVMGGIYVYQQMIPLCDQLIISIVKGKFIGNRYLKNIDLSKFEVQAQKSYEQFDVYYYQRKKS